MPPLVSIFTITKNRAKRLRHTIESVLTQTYSPIEYIIQDGASTDGTLDILKEYDDRIQLHSEPDSGFEEAFWKAIKRCQGEFIGACWSDEEMLPQAVEQAIAYFAEHPDIGVIHRDILLMDCNGEVFEESKGESFTTFGYFSGKVPPHFASAFFRRSALLAAGLHTHPWNPDCSEFELWCRLGLFSKIEYLPGASAKFMSHQYQLSRNAKKILSEFRGKIQVMSQLFEENPNGLLTPYLDRQDECVLITGFSIANFLEQRINAPEEALRIRKFLDQYQKSKQTSVS